MRIAYCFSGHLRTFLGTFPALQPLFFAKFPGDVFIHTWDTLCSSSKTHWRGDAHPLAMARINDRVLNRVQEMYRPRALVVENQERVISPHEPLFDATGTVAYRGLYCMWYGVTKVNDYRIQAEQEDGVPYDVVFRMRFDLLFKKGITDADLQQLDGIYLARNDNAFRVGGLSDVFFYGSPAVVDIFVGYFRVMEKYLLTDGKFISPELTYGNYLIDTGISIKPSAAEFDLLRINGFLQDFPQREFKELHPRFQ